METDEIEFTLEDFLENSHGIIKEISIEPSKLANLFN
jgi:hypothetical protein